MNAHTMINNVYSITDFMTIYTAFILRICLTNVTSVVTFSALGSYIWCMSIVTMGINCTNVTNVKKISYKQSLQTHQLICKLNSKLKCDMCPETFTRRNVLKGHTCMLSKHGNTQFPCRTCGKGV